jgi:hypothetical protein
MWVVAVHPISHHPTTTHPPHPFPLLRPTDRPLDPPTKPKTKTKNKNKRWANALAKQVPKVKFEEEIRYDDPGKVVVTEGKAMFKVRFCICVCLLSVYVSLALSVCGSVSGMYGCVFVLRKGGGCVRACIHACVLVHLYARARSDSIPLVVVEESNKIKSNFFQSPPAPFSSLPYSTTSTPSRRFMAGGVRGALRAGPPGHAPPAGEISIYL